MESPADHAETTGLTPTVKALGVVSLFTDISSEMVYPLNPVFMTAVLGAPVWAVGLVEGIAESTASLLKLWSGWLSDRAGLRKPFAVAGYGLSALAKPLMAVAAFWPHVLGARFLDRVGKGVRTAPRDALITENCAPNQRGRAFGFHRSLDTVGAVVGPLLGYLYLRAHPKQFRVLYALAFIPAIIGVLILAAVVRERRSNAKSDRQSDSPAGGLGSKGFLASIRHLEPAYLRYLGIIGLFSAGNSSDAFLLLRARGMGVAAEQILLLYALFNVVEASLGYAAGRLSDRVGRRPVLIAGFGVFALVYLGFAEFNSAVAAWVLFPIYGLYYTLTQGVQKALAADLTHSNRRATELGAFHMLVGIAALPASLTAGILYSRVSPSAPFLLGASCAGGALLLLLLTRHDSAPRPT